MNETTLDFQKLEVFYVTGTFHGSIVTAETEGDARRAFHTFYKGESIVTVKRRGDKNKFNLFVC